MKKNLAPRTCKQVGREAELSTQDAPSSDGAIATECLSVGTLAVVCFALTAILALAASLAHAISSIISVHRVPNWGYALD